jgi:outer membrane protein with beta-barrel domain
MPNSCLLRARFVRLTAACRVSVLAALGAITVSAPASAQWWRLGHRPDPWVLAVDGGGSYSVSDLEIVPGTDQNGGWSWDAGLRLEHGRGGVGVGYEQSRFDVGPDGSSTTSGIYVRPRFSWGDSRSPVRPYLFANVTWIFDYDVSTFCCSVYTASADASGWAAGGGFGIATAPVGHVRFDLSARVDRMSGQSEASEGPWNGAGPVIGVRLGASVPLFGGR